MPARQRRPKRRIDKDAELAAWRMTFSSGFDYLRELSLFGIRTDDQARIAARAAWRKHGAAFLALHWRPTLERPLPWAALEFGLPEKGSRDAS